MTNTALGAGAEKAKEIIFISEAHEKFYYEKLKEVRYQDVYHKALCYCLGINDDTRRNANRIYDFKTGCVKTECLHEGWQTSGSVKVVRMAFNLYGLMLDRMSLSMKNGWLDDENRAYIIYTVDAIMEDLGCAKATCVKIMKELDTENGIGLIEKKRRGLGKPDIIYVKNFSTITDAQTEEKIDNTDKSTEVQKLNLKKSNMHTSRSSEIELQEVQDLEHQKFTMQTSRGSESELAEVHKADPIYTNYNQTNQSYTDISYTNPINQSGKESKSEKRIDLIGLV